jgi:hypothetical protein
MLDASDVNLGAGVLAVDNAVAALRSARGAIELA